VAQAALDARNARFRQRDPALRSMAEDADPAARDPSGAPSSEMEVVGAQCCRDSTRLSVAYLMAQFTVSLHQACANASANNQANGSRCL
jgi:hypothetical protein